MKVQHIEILTIFMFLPLFVHSAKLKKQDSSFINLCGEILDERIQQNPNFQSKIHITVSEFPFSVLEMGSLPNNKYELNYKFRDTFKLKIPVNSKSVYLHISYKLPQQYLSTYNWIDNIYIVNNGDSIFCKLSDDKRKRMFYGRGAEKVQCQVDIYNLKYHPSAAEKRMLQHVATFTTGLNSIYRRQDSLLWLQLNIINRNRKRLGENLTQTLLANSIGLQYYSFLRGLYISKLQDTAFLREFMKSKIYGKIQKVNFTGSISSNIATAPIYSSFIYQREAINGLIRNLDKNNSPDSHEKFWQFYHLFMNYSGSLRDKMLTHLVINHSRSGTIAITALKEILPQMTDSLYVKALKEIRDVKNSGVLFGDFVLQEASGKNVHLSSFFDRVVILDFWYTGCNPCIKLNKSMYPVYKYFENNPNVTFISVSIDKERSVWIASLHEEKYTNPKGIHLFTGGKGTNHPIIIDKLINSYPTLFLLVRDKVFFANPAKPIDGKSTQDMINLINNAVKELSND